MDGSGLRYFVCDWNRSSAGLGSSRGSDFFEEGRTSKSTVDILPSFLSRMGIPTTLLFILFYVLVIYYILYTSPL